MIYMGCAHREYEICNECNEKMNMLKQKELESMEDLRKQNRILQKRLRDYARQNIYYIKSLKSAEERNFRQRQDLRKLKEAYLVQIGAVPYYSGVVVNALESIIKKARSLIKRVMHRTSKK